MIPEKELRRIMKEIIELDVRIDKKRKALSILVDERDKLVKSIYD